MNRFRNIFHRKSIFRKTAVIFTIAALVPALILAMKSHQGYAAQTQRLVDAGAMSSEEATEFLDNRRQQMIFYGGYGLVLVLVLGYFFASSLVRPIRSLQQGARKIGEGDLDHRVETETEDELEELAITINQMADSIQTREAEIEARHRRQSILYDLAHALAEARDLDEIVECSLNRLGDIVGTGIAGNSLLLKNRRGELVAAGCGDNGNGACGERPERIYLKAAAAAIRAGQPMVFDCADECCLDQSDAFACIPIKLANEFQGAICVSGSHSDFDQDNLDLLTAVASEVALAIENVNLLQQMEDQNRELAMATFEIADLISEAERNRSFDVRYKNPNLIKCWEQKNCVEYSCPAHNSSDYRCWQIAGTLCEDSGDTEYLDKMDMCEKCDVYQAALSDRITVLGETFNNMMAVLEKQVREQEDLQRQLFNSSKLAAIGELAAGMAHEINNPLTGILANAMLLKARPEDGEALQKRLEVIEGEALRAREIVRNLLDFSRQGEMRPASVSIGGLIEHTLALVGHQADLTHVKIETDLPEGLPEVTIDQNQIKQVFMNIIHNALHAMTKGGKLVISAGLVNNTKNRQVMEIRFTDSGPGMDSETIARIFDPFFTTKPAGEGTGLGLSISQRIVNEHGGEIRVESKPGTGSTFILTLPLLRSLDNVSEGVA